MEALFDHGLSTGSAILLFLCLAIALGFEFVNGFHDTANAVATVIYTNALRPGYAVALSGLCNFTGVFLGGIAVALGIMKLLPLELLVSSGAGMGLAMVLALLLSAILWNLGTWYKGLPASSSHTLIGSILGVGIANSMRAGHHFGRGVNWAKAGEIGLSLVISPVLGFVLAAGLLLLVRRYAKNTGILVAPPKDLPPPTGVRALLIATCASVSFAHGSNDGQKGVGLVMLILMGFAPAAFALNLQVAAPAIEQANRALATAEQSLDAVSDKQAVRELRGEVGELAAILHGKQDLRDIAAEQRWQVRRDVLMIDSALKKIEKTAAPASAKQLKKAREDLRGLTDYAPSWVLFCVALSLGIGTMVGWKRIVVTVGEKIGKEGLTYAQGASAQLVAMSTIGLSAGLGLPVSTTHVLSSGIAGTMVAQRSGLQMSTIRKILSAWVLTLPASIVLAGVLFLVLRAMLA